MISEKLIRKPTDKPKVGTFFEKLTTMDVKTDKTNV